MRNERNKILRNLSYQKLQYFTEAHRGENRKVLFNTKAIDWYVYDPIEDYEL